MGATRPARVRHTGLIRRRGLARWIRPAIEPLEERRMLDGGLPAAITVGRALSRDTPSGVGPVGVSVSYEMSITYTVYNETDRDISGVLLTTSLPDDVSFADATVRPDRDGSRLAWSLGTLGPSASSSVTVAIVVAGSSTLVLDGGATAYATQDARAVTDTAPAARLFSGTVDPALFAATPDADKNDPFVRRKAAELDYSTSNILDYLRDQVGYESYTGSMRGARGTLWSGAGNALDEASLGVALLRASGVPARYVQGTLADGLARQLILSMFPATFQSLGYVPPDAAVGDPANDPALLAEARDHFWIQFGDAGGFHDVDTSFATGQVDQAFAPQSATFAEVPDALRQKVTLRMDAETYTQAAALFGGSGLGTATVLSGTFNLVDLVGKPITIAHSVQSSSLGTPVFASTTNTYTPYFLVDGDRLDSSGDAGIFGTTYQEMATNFPLGNQILTGLFLNIDVQIPGKPTETTTRTLADLIGPAARRNGGNIATAAAGTPLISSLDVWTLAFQTSKYDPAALAAALNDGDRLAADFADLGAQLLATPPGPEHDALAARASDAMRGAIIAFQRSRLAYFQVLSDAYAAHVASTLQVKSYFDSPRIVIGSSRATVGAGGTANLAVSLDLRRNDIRTVIPPGQATAAGIGFRYNRDGMDNQIEADVLASATDLSTSTFSLSTPVATATIIQAAGDQGIPLVTLQPGAAQGLAALAISADAKARIQDALMAGKTVVVPARAPTVAGTARLAWYEIDLATGETTGVMEDGQHGSIVEFVANQLLNPTSGTNQVAEGIIAGAAAKGIVDLAFFLYGIGLKAALGQANDQAADDLANIKQQIATFRRFITREIEQALYGKPGLFQVGFWIGFAGALYFSQDPPAEGYHIDPDGRLVRPDPRIGAADRTVASTSAAGAVNGGVAAANVDVSGSLTASWQTAAESVFEARTLEATGAVVRTRDGTVVGTGTVALTADALTAILVAGGASVAIQGQGELAFYGPAGAALGAGGTWASFLASLTGGLTLTLTTNGLKVDGSPLAAGTYVITADSARIAGSGRTSTPNFAGTATVTVAAGTVAVGPGGGSLTVGGAAVDLAQGATLGGYTGTVTLAGNAGDEDAATLDGSATAILGVAAGSAGLQADQNTPVTIPFQVRTSLAGDYTLTAEAPEGWTVALGSGDQIVVTPAPGLQGGTFTIRLVARSKADPTLVAQAEVPVTVAATQPGVTVAITPDPTFTVPLGQSQTPTPFDGTQIPSAFRATVRNLGPTAETFALTFPDPPAGFEIIATTTQVTIPAGQTATIGLYLRPIGQVPAPGTIVPFGLVATSTADPTLTDSATSQFVVPEIHGVSLVNQGPGASTTPGSPATVVLTLQAIGNVPEVVDLTARATSAGLTVAGLGAITLAVGETKTVTLTLTPDASTPLNSTLSTIIIASSGAALDQELAIPVRVAVPGADAIAAAVPAARQSGNPALADRLDDLSVALTNLVQDPANAVFKGQALASLDSVIALVAADPALAPIAGDLTAARGPLAAATTAADVQAATVALGAVLGDLGTRLTDLVRHRFELSFLANSQVAQPNTPATFTLVLRNLGDTTTTYALGLEGLSPGLTGVFSQDEVTLAPGAITTSVTVTLTPDNTADFASALGFLVRATAVGAAGVTGTAAGTFTVRAEFVSVVSVATDPGFVAPGGTIQVTARVLNAVNRVQDARASFVVRDGSNQVVFTSTPVAITLGVQTSITAADLGPLDTTGLAAGNYTIAVSLTDPAGTPIPGGTGEGHLLVGTPVSATLTLDQDQLPAGDGTVTNTLTVRAQAPLVGPLGVVSQTDLPGAVGVVQNGNLVYASGTDGIHIYDVTDRFAPQSIRTFGSSATQLEVHGDKLYALERFGAFNRFYLRIYSLADPADPQFLGSATYNNQEGIPYSLAWHMVVTDTHVYVALWGFTYLLPNDIKFQTGDLIAIDVSDPTTPHFESVLRNTYGTNDDGIGQFLNVDVTGGDGPLWEIVQADANTLLVAGSTVAGDDSQNGNGVVHVVDISDPAHMTIVKTLVIPGTVQAVGLSIDGDRALVTGSTTGWEDLGSLDFTGKTVLASLDISDPRNPVLLGTRTLDRSSRSPADQYTSALGNGLFVFSSRYDTTTTEAPALFVVDANDPQNLGFSSTTIPAFTGDLDGRGSFVYTTSSSGLIGYQIDAPDSIPTTARVDIPRNAGVALVPGSFSVTPSQVIAGADFDTYVFDLNLSGTPQTITWQTTITGLAAGESRTVAQGGSVAFTFQGSDGTFDLPALSVAGLHLLGLDPGTQAVSPGAPAGYTLTVSNPGTTEATYALAIAGIPAAWSDLPASVTVAAGASVDLPFTLTSAALAALGTYGFRITASAGAVVADSVEGSLALQGTPVFAAGDAHGIVVAILPAEATAGPGTAARYVARVTNTGSAAEGFNLDFVLPAGVTVEFDPVTTPLTPGAGNYRDVAFRLRVASGVAPGSVGFQVRASLAADATVADQAAGTLNIVATGVGVALDTATTTPGGVVMATITNTGTVADTFDLALAGPGSLFATLGASAVTLGPGESQTIPVAIGSLQGQPQMNPLAMGPISSVLPGGLSLAVLATSRLNPAVSDAAAATIAVGATAGLQAGFDQDVRIIPVAGTTKFYLFVRNTGNESDQYTATIIGTTGRITASLIGLDGRATQTVDGFILPALSSAVLVLQADLATPGPATTTSIQNQGQAMVRVTSLSDASRTTTATATVVIPQGTVTTVAATPGTIAAGQAVTLAADIAISGIPDTITGTITFTIDGQDRPPVPVAAVGGGGFGARLVVEGLAVGTHTITAAYSGDATHTASVAAATTVTVTAATTPAPNPQVTTTNVTVTPGTIAAGQAATLTATIATAGTPTGTITFTVDGQDRPPVPVSLVGGVPGAQLVVEGLAVGTHTVTATYSGDATHTASTALAANLVVVADAGPQVVDARAFGVRQEPTTIVLTFDRALDAARARNVANYKIVGACGQRIGVSRVIYDAATHRLAIRTRQRLDSRATYRLIVNGRPPRGVTSAFGSLIDGNKDGKPGGNFVLILSKANLRNAPAPLFAVPQRAALHPRGPLARSR